MINKRNYKELSYEPFSKLGYHFPVLVWTGKDDEECRPVFKTVMAEAPAKVNKSGYDVWGIVGFDAVSGESEWYEYNHCVSLEDFGVLDKMLATRYSWMQHISGMKEETKLLAKAQWKEGV
jgi:hypothetical protein|nr:MAG TPA: hypothetical protein [Caudoviricetes sp.]